MGSPSSMLDGWLVSAVVAWGECRHVTRAVLTHPPLRHVLLEQIWEWAAHDHGSAAEH